MSTTENTKSIRYVTNADDFSKIPGSPVAYWVSNKKKDLFGNDKIELFAFSDGQNITGNNERFLRYMWEISSLDIGSNQKWVLCARGGPFRRWYGNTTEVIDWSEDARLFYKKDKISRIVPEYIRFRNGISWSRIASANIGFRFLSSDELFEKTGVSIFPKDDKNLTYLLGLLNTCVTKELMKLITQVITLQVRDVFSIPCVLDQKCKDNIDKIVFNNIDLSRKDWDSFETSWDFKKHPLI